jgi:hypothetical protein
VADNSVQSGSDTIRDKDRSGVKTQIFGIDLNPGGATEKLQTYPKYIGRSGTFRTPGRAGTAGQKLHSIYNGSLSAVAVTVTFVAVDLVATVVKAVTVLPPVVRLYKVTVLPTLGTSLGKTQVGGLGSSSDSNVTLLGDASADGTGSVTALTATLPSGAFVTQEFAPRLITAAGYEMADRMEFFGGGDQGVDLPAGTGLVLALDYTLATQNPTTDMWISTLEWTET